MAEELTIGQVFARNQRKMLALEDEAREEFMQAFQRVRRKLRDRLDSIPDTPMEIPHFRVMQAQIEQTIRVLQGDLQTVLIDGTRIVGNTAISQAAEEIARLQLRYERILQPIDFDRAAILSRSENLLLMQYQVSLETYGVAMIDEMRKILVDGLLSGEFTSRVSRQIAMLGGIFDRQAFRAERIVRTELNNAYNTHHLESYRQAQEEIFPDMKKKWLAMIDDRTGDDSIRLTGQVRALDERFIDPGTGRSFLHPPERPNSRCRIIPWRDAWQGAA